MELRQVESPGNINTIKCKTYGECVGLVWIFNIETIKWLYLNIIKLLVVYYIIMHIMHTVINSIYSSFKMTWINWKQIAQKQFLHTIFWVNVVDAEKLTILMCDPLECV